MIKTIVFNLSEMLLIPEHCQKPQKFSISDGSQNSERILKSEISEVIKFHGNLT